jgi:hypothetical protein
MSAFALLLAICPSLGKMGIEAARIANTDKKLALEKLGELSASLIRILIHFEGLEKTGEAVSPWPACLSGKSR